MKILQIGCNNGDDEIFNIIKNNIVDFALLVDANPFVLDLAKERYKNYNNVKIECHLITNEETEKTFYIPHFEGHRYSQHSSVSKELIVKHGHKLEEMREFSMKTTTIENLFKNNNLTSIDYLYIDCEGEDYNIINSINFDIVDIKKLTFEHDHIPLKQKNYPLLLDKLRNFKYEIESINLGNVTLIKK